MKNKILRWFGCGILALSFVIGISGCAGKKNDKGGNDRNDSSTKSDTTEKEITSSGTETESEQTDPTGYDDSLIADAYADSGKEMTSWEYAYSYEVHIPELLCDSGDAKVLNREIMEYYGADGMCAPDPDIIKNSINWESHWNGSLLSLEITAGQPDGEIYHDIYYFDFATKTRLSSDEVLNRMGLSWDTLEPALIRTAVREHDRMMQAADLEYTRDMIADTLALRAQTIMAAQDANLPFYPNSDGTLTVFFNIATYAGAGWMQKDCIVDLSEKAGKLSTRYEFIVADVDENGVVTVEYHEYGDTLSGTDYQSIYGFAFDTPYTIRGCFGDYTELFIGNIGSGFEPYLFLMTENGTLEYVNLFLCTRYETYVCSGPLYGITDVTELYAGIEEKSDYSYATVYAMDKSGKKHDLLKNIYISDALPYEMQGSFSAENANGVTCDISFSIEDGVRAQRDNEIYTGFPLRLGLNEYGMIYALDLWDDVGNETLSICALLPGNGMLVLTQLAGGSTFDLTPGETMYLPKIYN